MLKEFERIRNFRVLTATSNNLAASLNIGLMNCNTEFVAILDGDDLMRDDRIFRQIKFLRENPDVAAVGSDFYQIDVNGNLIKLIKMPSIIDLNSGTHWLSSPVAHSSVLIRKKILDELGGYREFFQFAEDFDLWLRINQKYKIVNLNIPLTHYRVHSKQTTSNNFKRLAWVQVAARIDLRNRKKGLPEFHTIFKDFESWKKLQKFNPKINYQVLYEILLHNTNKYLNSGKKYYSIITRIITVVFFPSHTFRKIKLYIKKLIKLGIGNRH